MANSRGRYVSKEPNLADIVADLQKRIADLEAGNRIGYTSIDAGQLNVAGGSFQVGIAFYVGPVTMGPDTTDGWILRRADGSIVGQLAGSSNSDQFWAYLDNEGNIILSDDGQTNRGLGRPYIPVQFGPHSRLTFLPSTVNAAFEGMLVARFPRQHPRVQIDCYVKAGAATTGEIQLVNNTTGVVIAGPTVISSAFTGIMTLGPVNVGINTATDIPHMSTVELEIQARRTGGANTITVEVYGAYGLQS